MDIAGYNIFIMSTDYCHRRQEFRIITIIYEKKVREYPSFACKTKTKVLNFQLPNTLISTKILRPSFTRNVSSFIELMPFVTFCDLVGIIIRNHQYLFNLHTFDINLILNIIEIFKCTWYNKCISITFIFYFFYFYVNIILTNRVKGEFLGQPIGITANLTR